MDTKIEAILKAAIAAPSGENCQPWHFKVRGNEILVYLVPERDQSLYNFGHRASYMAVGAAIENIVIEASRQGVTAEVSFFENTLEANVVARITLTSSKTTPDPLAEYILERTTNRKPFKKDSLLKSELEALQDAARNIQGPKILFTDTQSELSVLGKVGATNEEVMLTNEQLHAFFFSHVNWTKEEDEEKKIGFFIDTLELPPPARLMFKVFKKWGVMKQLIRIGFHRIVGKENAATYAKASAMGALVTAGDTPIDFVQAGRTMERVWLTATSLGLQFQPITGILYFYLRLKAGDRGAFTIDQQKQILDAYEKAETIFAAQGKTISFMFRVGRGSPPSARSVRFSLEESVTIE